MNFSHFYQTEMDTAYYSLKKKLYLKFFKTIMIILIASPAVDILQGFFKGDLASIQAPSILLLSGLLASFLISQSVKNQELWITLFLTLLNFAFLAVQYHEGSHFDDVFSGYHFGHETALYEGIILTRISRFPFRILYSILILFTRVLVVPAVDKGQYISQLVCLGIGVYLDYDREKHDQHLFTSYFKSKEQLVKFKDLVVNDIPNAIIILSQDLKQSLFANNKFSELLESRPTIIDVEKTFQQFLIQEAPCENNSTESSLSSPRRQESLFSFLKTLTSQTSKKETFPKATCYLNLKVNSQNSHFFQAKILPINWDDHPEAIAIILHDITQENTIIRLKTAASIQKDRLLATVSHELRTPLNGMLGMITIMQQQTKDQDLLHYLDICNSSGHLLLGLVNSILDLNLIRANKLRLYPATINPQTFFQDILRLFEFQTKQKRLSLTLKISPLVPKTVTTDKNRLSQILINLIGNALKFTSQGGITITVNLYTIDRDFIEISVEDTGIGIKEEEQSKLFQMFSKLDHEAAGNRTIVNNQGVGLGLTISNNLAKFLCANKYMDGIKLESRYGRGSRFSFLISKVIDPKFEKQAEVLDMLDNDLSVGEGDIHDIKIKEYKYMLSPNQRKPSALLHGGARIKLANETKKHVSLPPHVIKSTLNKDLAGKNGHSKNSEEFILIVDDNPLNISVVEFFIEKHHYQAKAALCGQTAVDIVRNNNHSQSPIKIILMDLQMPLMDGYQTTKLLKNMMSDRTVPNIPIIALTANDSDNDRRMCQEVGMCDYLVKPLKESELLKIIKKYC